MALSTYFKSCQRCGELDAIDHSSALKAPAPPSPHPPPPHRYILLPSRPSCGFHLDCRWLNEFRNVGHGLCHTAGSVKQVTEVTMKPRMLTDPDPDPGKVQTLAP